MMLSGRVHAAVISGINETGGTVTVEWFENEETKGKELDFKSVLSMNPDLAANGKGVDRPVAHAPPADPTPPPAPVNAAPARKLPTVQEKAPAAAAPKAARPSTGGAGATPSRGASKQSSVSSVAAAQPTPTPKPPAPTNAAAAKADAKKAPSKTVLEIQKLEKQREERRAKQQEALDKRDNRGGKDNVNIEFMQMIEDYREGLEIQPLDPNGAVSQQKITVCLRKRPLNKKELGNFDYDVVTIPNGSTTLVHEPKTKVDLSKYLDHHEFHFDHAFDEDVKNSTVYRYTAAPLVKTVFEGGFATCFAYGQTGMFLYPSLLSIYPLCCRKWQDVYNGRGLHSRRRGVQRTWNLHIRHRRCVPLQSASREQGKKLVRVGQLLRNIRCQGESGFMMCSSCREISMLLAGVRFAQQRAEAAHT